jgi:hypothetical protein
MCTYFCAFKIKEASNKSCGGSGGGNDNGGGGGGGGGGRDV